MLTPKQKERLQSWMQSCDTYIENCTLKNYTGLPFLKKVWNRIVKFKWYLTLTIEKKTYL